jgi:hypothetical protein
MSTRAAEVCRSVVEDRQIQPAEAHWVCEDVELNYPPASNSDPDYSERSSLRSDDDPRGAVYKRRSHERGEPCEGERLPDYGRRTMNHPRAACRPPVGPEYDVWVEERK